jgi:hypothetical protein
VRDQGILGIRQGGQGVFHDFLLGVQSDKNRDQNGIKR